MMTEKAKFSPEKKDVQFQRILLEVMDSSAIDTKD